jgi:predicted ATP-dependent endonuclease of OLD family
MALERLVIENYRSIERLDLALGALNALLGPNNSGKSNILRALRPWRDVAVEAVHGP